MIRRVAYGKAIIAGTLGAAAWEIVARVLSLLGIHVFDLVFTLGTTVFPNGAPAWKWWPAGMIVHCLVGSVWAIFYSYFFWSTFDYRPIIQGVLFSLLPTVLAGLVMVPQLGWMHPATRDDQFSGNGLFAWEMGLGGPAMIILGHLIYGTVLGTLYVRPVGYRAGKRIRIHA